MGWRDQLRSGSFRGVPFLIEGHERAGGRRAEIHEFPQRDEPYSEDLGRAAHRYSVNCYVLGPNYMADRDALLAAAEAEGSGTLIHPYLGSLLVQCLTVSMSEHAQDGGIAFFQLAFVEAGAKPAPSTGSDTQAAALTAADDGQERLAGGFASIFRPDMRGFVVDAMTGVVQSAAASISGLGAGVLTDAARFALSRATGALANQASGLLATPLKLATQVMGSVNLLRSAATTPSAGLGLMTSLMGFGGSLAAVPGATPARLRQAANQSALINLVRQAGAVGAVRSAAQSTFATYDDALQVRATLADALDDLALDAADAADDTAYGALGDLRGAMVRDLTARGASLARISSFAPATTLPALVVAHRLYGNATRDQELIDRNRAGHPGFMGQAPLQVLIDA